MKLGEALPVTGRIGAGARVTGCTARAGAAAPLPPPARMGKVRYVEVWLVDKSGKFQVHSLTEGQR